MWEDLGLTASRGSMSEGDAFAASPECKSRQADGSRFSAVGVCRLSHFQLPLSGWRLTWQPGVLGVVVPSLHFAPRCCCTVVVCRVAFCGRPHHPAVT